MNREPTKEQVKGILITHTDGNTVATEIAIEGKTTSELSQFRLIVRIVQVLYDCTLTDNRQHKISEITNSTKGFLRVG